MMRNYSFTIKDICEKLWELEEKYDLLNMCIRNTKPWQFCRMKIYYKIAEKVGLFSKPHGNKYSPTSVKRIIPQLFYNLIVKNPLIGNYKKKILIFDHDRKINFNDEYIDIYTNNLIKNLDNKDYEVIEKDHYGKHLAKKERNRKYFDRIALGTFIYRKFTQLALSNTEKTLIKTVENEINAFFNIDFDLNNLFTYEIKRFIYQYKCFDKLIKKREPKTIYLVIGYEKAALIAAARKYSVETIELQHGTFSPYHMGYSYPNGNKNLDYFPDKFYIFGEFWSSVVKLPIDKSNLIIYGFHYIRNRRYEFKNIAKDKKQVLFISQGVIGKELAEVAYNLAINLPAYKIVFKLHPGEFDIWQNEYETLLNAKDLDNFTIVDNNKENLYKLFAQSEYQVGVFSTALYEGLMFGCKTILVDLPGIEYMEYLVNCGLAKKVTNIKAEDLIHSEYCEFDSSYFF